MKVYELKYVEWTDFKGKADEAINEFQQDAGEGNGVYHGWEVGADYEDNGWGYISKEGCEAIDTQLREAGLKDGDNINIHIWW